jgi:hypothetical protein
MGGGPFFVPGRASISEHFRNMAYCVICGRSHDSSLACTDATGQALRDIGIPCRAERGEPPPRTAGLFPIRKVVFYVCAALLLIYWVATRLQP